MNHESQRTPRALAYSLAILAGLLLYLFATPPLRLWVMMHDGKHFNKTRPWLEWLAMPYHLLGRYEPLRTPLLRYDDWCTNAMGYNAWIRQQIMKEIRQKKIRT